MSTRVLGMILRRWRERARYRRIPPTRRGGSGSTRVVESQFDSACWLDRSLTSSYPLSQEKSRDAALSPPHTGGTATRFPPSQRKRVSSPFLTRDGWMDGRLVLCVHSQSINHLEAPYARVAGARVSSNRPASDGWMGSLSSSALVGDKDQRSSSYSSVR